MNNFMYVMALVGIVTLLVIMIFFSFIALEYLGEFIAEKSYEWKRKRRFNKPPKAKCYCVDCAFYDERTYCSVHKFYAVDNYFCKTAIPRRSEVKKDG